MSNCEQFAQIAQDKWATVSESLRSLKTNEQPWAIRSGHSKEMSKLAIRSTTGKLMGNHWETIKKLVENHRETTGKPLKHDWKTAGKLLSSHWEISWKLLRNHDEIAGKPLEHDYETIYKPLENHRETWETHRETTKNHKETTRKPLGNPWETVG